jgi:hypothetical protein
VSPASKYYFGDIAEKSRFPGPSGGPSREFDRGLRGDGVLEYLDGGVRELTLRFIACNEDPARLMAARKAASDLKAAGFDVDSGSSAARPFSTPSTSAISTILWRDNGLRRTLIWASCCPRGAGPPTGWRIRPIAGLIRGFSRRLWGAKEAAARELYSHIAETCPLIPLAFDRSKVLVHRGWVSGMEPTCQTCSNGIACWTVNLQ